MNLSRPLLKFNARMPAAPRRPPILPPPRLRCVGRPHARARAAAGASRRGGWAAMARRLRCPLPLPLPPPLPLRRLPPLREPPPGGAWRAVPPARRSLSPTTAPVSRGGAAARAVAAIGSAGAVSTCHAHRGSGRWGLPLLPPRARHSPPLHLPSPAPSPPQRPLRSGILPDRCPARLSARQPWRWCGGRGERQRMGAGMGWRRAGVTRDVPAGAVAAAITRTPL